MATVIPGELDPLQRGLTTGLALGQRSLALYQQKEFQEAQAKIAEERNAMMSRRLALEEELAPYERLLLDKQNQAAQINLDEAMLSQEDRLAKIRAESELTQEALAQQQLLGDLEIPRTQKEKLEQEIRAGEQALDLAREQGDREQFEHIMRIIAQGTQTAALEQRIETEALQQQLLARDIEAGMTEAEARAARVAALPVQTMIDALQASTDPTADTVEVVRERIDALFDAKDFLERTGVADTEANRVAYTNMQLGMNVRSREFLQRREELDLATQILTNERARALQQTTAGAVSGQQKEFNKWAMARSDALSKNIIPTLHAKSLGLTTPEEKAKNEAELKRAQAEVVSLAEVLAGMKTMQQHAKQFKAVPRNAAGLIQVGPNGEFFDRVNSGEDFVDPNGVVRTKE
jgi:hypothetical protein